MTTLPAGCGPQDRVNMSAATGPTGVRSPVLIALWDAVGKDGIKLPIPRATRVLLEQPK